MQIVRIGDGSGKRHAAEVIGAKAAHLSRVAALGLPVPPAFVLPISLCAAIVNRESRAQEKLADGLREGIKFLEGASGKRFGDRRRPLLVSVRSGAARSMPGMLDTVLDVGCTLAAVHGLVRVSGNPRFAWECRRRFLESYGGVVLGADLARLRQLRTQLVAAEGVADERALDGEALERLAKSYQERLEADDFSIPDDAMEQLEAAACAVYRSWSSERACTYRRYANLEDLAGTAVMVQAMVYGNRNLASGAGVAFSRDPSTGVAQPVIDILFGAQGEDVVSGTSTPESETAIARSLPAVASDLREILTRLEREFADVQDVEFTVEDGKLWVLQTRSAKRTPQAALRFAIDFVKEGLMSPTHGLRRLKELDLSKFTRQRLVDVPAPVACGTPASAGIAVGRAAFDSTSAERMAANDPVILVRPDTSTADVAGFAAAAGIVTAVGGRTAHAALVARQMAKPCIVGCRELKVSTNSPSAELGGRAIKQGDWLSIDGETGAIYFGEFRVAVERPEAELAEIQSWHNQPARRAALPQPV